MFYYDIKRCCTLLLCKNMFKEYLLKYVMSEKSPQKHKSLQCLNALVVSVY